MLMNAQPRRVSHGFSTFVPRNREESSYQSFLVMMNNKVDTLGLVEPVTSTVQVLEDWDYGFEVVNHNDNYSLSPDLDNGYRETGHPHNATPVVSQNWQQARSSKELRENCTIARQQSQNLYDLYGVSSIHLERPVSAFSSNDGNWTDCDAPCLVPEYSRARLPSTVLQCHASGVSSGQSIMGLSSTMPATCGFISADSPRGSDTMYSDGTSPRTVYSSSFTSDITSDPRAPSFNSLVIQDDVGDNKWWEGFHQGSRGTKSTSNTALFSYDGLPDQQFSSVLPPCAQPTSWPDRYIPLETVSPHALALNPVTPCVPACESSCYQISVSGSRSHQSNEKTPAISQITSSKTSATMDASESCRPRHKLPSVPSNRSQVHILYNNDCGSTKSKKQRFKQSRQNSLETTTSRCNSPSRHMTKETSSTMRYSTAPKKIEPKESVEDAPRNAQDIQEVETVVSEKNQPIRREDLDEFLVKSKRAGLSYKEIRRRGGFTEAESTLRGRFRTLTKNKDERVRRPEWEDHDIRLLRKAVQKLAYGSDPAKQKIPWKQVADYIYDHGGSYHFGNATCRKRWDQLQS